MRCVVTWLCVWITAIPLAGVIFARTDPAKNANQPMLSIPIRIVDPEGKPLPKAVVVPWALRCSQGHGRWQPDGFGSGKPPTLTTDEQGAVEVPFPKYAIADEKVLTTEVTLSIDHPDFSYEPYEFIDIPRKETGPHTIKLKPGAKVEIRPVDEAGKPASLTGLHAIWSDSRSWQPGADATPTADGLLRILPMPIGKGQVLLVRLDGERATHMSRIVDLVLTPGDVTHTDIELLPVRRTLGRISDVVPRPVKNGRVKLETLSKKNSDNNVTWFTWAPIAADGTFAIDDWPSGESMQIIALCDGYMAESGAPPEVEQRKPTGPDPFHRPQVFSPADQAEGIVLQMRPTARCEVEAVDTSGKPVAGARIGSSPNVCWWNSGSQIYCSPLVRGERVLIKRDYSAAIDEAFRSPYSTKTDKSGKAYLELPPGNEELYAEHDGYELPITRGRRDQRIKLTLGETNVVKLVLQPKGSEHLGEWDKLGGVLFGCTGEQCRRLLNDPDFRAKMAKVKEMLDAAPDPNNPAVLSVAYMATADAFDALGDKEETVNWRRKAAMQIQKLASGDKIEPVAAKK